MKRSLTKKIVHVGRNSELDYPACVSDIMDEVEFNLRNSILLFEEDYEGECGASRLLKFKITADINIKYLGCDNGD